MVSKDDLEFNINLSASIYRYMSLKEFWSIMWA